MKNRLFIIASLMANNYCSFFTACGANEKSSKNEVVSEVNTEVDTKHYSSVGPGSEPALKPTEEVQCNA